MGFFKSLADRVNNFALRVGGGGAGEYGPEYGEDGYGEDYSDEEDARDADFDRKASYFDETRRFTIMHGEAKELGLETPWSARGEKIRHIDSGPQKRKTYITKPRSIDECCIISDKLKANCQIYVILDDVKHDMAQRIVDFLSGVTHAIDGTIESASPKSFVFAPKGWEIENDIEEAMEFATFLPTFKTGLR
ncbi:MAG: cell division protein SepF [Defluviitaleaceae bacterium]|nr:cell division protein SepF [Defluviitaleaceae bacterium]MCL2835635.1 cell division protein SepF [Defluviitaleaceae bacterium]